ncbi:13883_t:CDS:2, partial [Funneliformis geosporum]
IGIEMENNKNNMALDFGRPPQQPTPYGSLLLRSGKWKFEYGFIPNTLVFQVKYKNEKLYIYSIEFSYKIFKAEIE